MAKEQADLKIIVNNVLNSDDGFKFIQHLLNETGCFDRSVNFDEYKNFYFQGRKSIGDYILELARKCDFKSYIKILEKRKD